jgi:transcriptional regulator with XRE-family HTH domain
MNLLEYQERIAINILHLLYAKQINQAQLAKASRTSEGYISTLLRGDKNITLRMLCNISNALGVTAAQMLSEDL